MMQSLDAKKILSHCQKWGFKFCESRLLLAVSGGSDSMGMLRFFLKHKKMLKWAQLEVAHVHHGLRSVDADLDAQFVEKFCKENKAPFHLLYADSSNRVSREGIEAWARRERYQLLEDLCVQQNLTACLTAHTIEDQLETLMLRLERGTGLRGLAGILPVRSFRRNQRNAPVLLRPFLSNTREQLKSYAQANKEYREDLSNRDLRFSRNRWRHQILPVLKKKDAHLEEKAFRISERVAELLPKFEKWSCELFAENQRGLDIQSIRKQFQDAELEFAGLEDLLRIRMEQFLMARGIPFLGGRKEWEVLFRFLLKAKAGSRYFVDKSNYLQIQKGFLNLERVAQKISEEHFLEFDLEKNSEQNIEIPGGKWALKIESQRKDVKSENCGRATSEKMGEFSTLVSKVECPKKLILRWQKPGDRVGFGRGRKLKKFWNDHGISLEKRKTLPLLTNGERVFWIPGVYLIPECRAGRNLRDNLEIRLQWQAIKKTKK